ncbi:MAG: hypothetical protein Q8J88_13175 [Bacteroidales bacterium]|nr:hypothetical protein [Bacteroidales bacterium]
MKYNILYFLTVLTTVLLFTSCSKEQFKNEDQVNTVDQLQTTTDTESKIIAFRESIDAVRNNPNLKSDNAIMIPDDAEWFVEALANYTYGNAGYERTDLVIDSAVFVVPVSGGNIALTDVQVLYDEAVSKLSAQYSAINAENKQLVFADITLREVDENTATFALTSGFGTNEEEQYVIDYAWYWGWELGRCDSSGLGVGLDAADIIMSKANRLISVPSGNSYYTSVSYRTKWYWEVPTNTNPYGPYMLFHDFQAGTLIHRCLSPEEINYYRNRIIEIGNMYKPSNKSIISFLVEDATAYGSNSGVDTWDMCHYVEIKYAIWHTSNNPPAELN